MFLVLFGGIFADPEQSRLDMVQVGSAPLLDEMPAGAREAFDATVAVERSDDLDAAIEQVRTGDADVAVEMRGTEVVAHYTRTDQVGSAIVQGSLRALVDGTNVAVTGQPPTFTLRTEAVEDDSLRAIAYVTPGLLGWAVAMSAAFGAAATLNGRRQSGLLRRLQLAPVDARTLVSARVAVTLGIALVQMAIFLGLGVVFFGLTLTRAWPAAIPLLVVGTLCFMAIGLLAGAVAKSTEGAVNMANFIVLPMAFLSGSFFLLEGAAEWLQVVSRALPLRHLNDGMTDVMVRGDTWDAALAPVGILAVFAVVVTLLAARLFRWETT